MHRNNVDMYCSGGFFVDFEEVFVQEILFDHWSFEAVLIIVFYWRHHICGYDHLKRFNHNDNIGK